MSTAGEPPTVADPARAISEGPPNNPVLEGADGLDREFIAKAGRTVFRFLHDFYWRVEVRGLEHIPRQGPVMLTGLHRNIVPFDAMMVLHGVAAGTGRVPRFLIHPALLRFKTIGSIITKLGGVVACRENADWVLEQGRVLGMFPEGVRGAFAPYRETYRLHSFGRHDYISLALKHRAPVLPFVTVGSAETYPVWKLLPWKWWQEFSGWPGLPITPTFPFLPPVPLPSKWHTVFMEPMHFEREYPPEAARDRKLVRRLSEQVQEVLLAAMLDIKNRRKSIFWGNVFDQGVPSSRRDSSPGESGSSEETS